LSAARLVALAAQTQADVVRAVEAAGKRVATLSLAAAIRFESAAQREAFTAALTAAVTEVVGRYASPWNGPDGSDAPGRPYRLVLGCYPAPAPGSDAKKERP
jgi:hypothetical protein